VDVEKHTGDKQCLHRESDIFTRLDRLAKKAAPFLGPLFKEAERREVREDFARCRSDGQSEISGVVENYELW
jgi:hypothetical protein